MGKIKDLTGKTFGRLTVFGISKEKGNCNQIKWECLCVCGNIHTVTGESLRSGKSKSCGCLLRESRKSNVDRKTALIKVLYSKLKKRNTLFSSEKPISEKEFSVLIQQKCFYCGEEHSNTMEDTRHDSRKSKDNTIRLVSDYKLRYNGIDRLDSKKGYTKDNVVPCCKTCNIAKNKMSYEKFLSWINKIHKHISGCLTQ